MKLGFVGTGQITSALVEGWCTCGEPPDRVLVSPRNEGTADRLAARFPQVQKAAHNQAVVDGADTVILAVVPQIAREVLGGLRFHPHTRVITLLADTSVEQVRRWVAPATEVVRAVPLPCAARRVGPIAVHPEDDRAMGLFGRIGTAIGVRDEQVLNLFLAVTALMAPFYELIERVSAWTEAAGADRRAGGTYTASMFHALATLAVQVEDGRFSGLVRDSTTPGGLNEQALAVIVQGRGFHAVLDALDAVLARLGGSPPPRS